MPVRQSIGVIGLGKMGLPLCENLSSKGYHVTGFDLLEQNRQRLASLGMQTSSTLAELCEIITVPRQIILMVPAGKAVDVVIDEILQKLTSGDVVIDAGNSHYQDSVRRSAQLTTKGFGFLDVGISGGVSGARNGACLTVGGDRDLFDRFEPLFRHIAMEGGFMHVGPSGWGHLVKTIHNGIEYGFLQAIAEGIHAIKAVADTQGVAIDLAELCKVWGNGSIIASRLLNDAVPALSFLQKNRLSGRIGGGETGRWALEIAHQHDVSMPVLEKSLAHRLKSQDSPDFSGEIIAAIRNVFGAHEHT